MDPTLERALAQARGETQAGRHAEARAALEDLDVLEVLPRLPPEELYDYYLAYGCGLGEVGELAAMDDALTRAMTLAAEELGDLVKVRDVWYWMLHFGRQRADWSFLERQCQVCADFGLAVGSGSLRQLAAEFCAHAHKGLGKTELARRGAMKILRRLESIGAEKPRLQEWKDFLAALG